MNFTREATCETYFRQKASNKEKASKGKDHQETANESTKVKAEGFLNTFYSTSFDLL